jgi:hypothetical protein
MWKKTNKLLRKSESAPAYWVRMQARLDSWKHALRL